jgi:transcription initiation factor TFIID subunit 6
MPPILTCLVTKRLCEKATENHWKLRDFAANLLAKICSEFGDAYATLQPRVTRTLLRAFLDPLKSLTTHYGAIVGLSALGSNILKALLMPNTKAYVDLLRPELTRPDANPIKRDEAQHCFDMLKVAFDGLLTC